MQIPLGRVVGSKIRNGSEMPTDFTGWLDGDIFILNDENISYFEYKNGELNRLGGLRGPQGIQGEQGPQGTQGIQSMFPHNIEIHMTPKEDNNAFTNVYLYSHIYLALNKVESIDTLMQYIPNGVIPSSGYIHTTEFSNKVLVVTGIKKDDNGIYIQYIDVTRDFGFDIGLPQNLKIDSSKYNITIIDNTI